MAKRLLGAVVNIRRLYAYMFFRSRETRESKLRRRADDLAGVCSGDVPAYRSPIDVCLNNLDSDCHDSSSGVNHTWTEWHTPQANLTLNFTSSLSQSVSLFAFTVVFAKSKECNSGQYSETCVRGPHRIASSLLGPSASARCFHTWIWPL